MNLEAIKISAGLPLKQAVAQLDVSHHGIVVIVDNEDRAIGILTDPDIRRLLLKNIDFTNACGMHANKDFFFWTKDKPREGAVALMKQKRIRHLPVLSPPRELIDVISLDEIDFIQHENEIIIMAGGLGTRLRPLTDNCPKPMLPVNGKPILERIIEGFMDHGFSNFRLCINYLGNMIEDYFADGQKWGAKISYVKESQQLGTAGALSILDPVPDREFIVVNGDVITGADYSQFIQFHRDHDAIASLCVQKYDVKIPFGVVEIKDHIVCCLSEKPVHSSFVNAGIYCLSPQSLDFLKENEVCNMPDLFNNLRKHGHKTTAFPLHEQWIDIGRHEDFSRAGRVVS